MTLQRQLQQIVSETEHNCSETVIKHGLSERHIEHDVSGTVMRMTVQKHNTFQKQLYNDILGIVMEQCFRGSYSRTLQKQ